MFALSISSFGASSFERYGAGCTGPGGDLPSMWAVGAPSISGGPLQIGIKDATTNAPCALLLATSRGYTPLGTGGCALLVDLSNIPVFGTCDSLGSFGISVSVGTDPSFAGLSLYWTGVVIDPNGAVLNTISVSDAMRVVIGS